MSNNAIEVNHLSKNYEVGVKLTGLLPTIKSFFHKTTSIVHAVKDISFTIKPGELVGFIGPNGAGKTTTLKVLSGLLYPSSGGISVLGYEPWRRQPEFQKQFALLMGQKNQLMWDLSANDSYQLLKDIYQISDHQYQQTLAQLSSMLQVQDLLTTPVRKLSLGQRMKMELIASLLHSPKLLFLDEPTIGLDVVMQQVIRQFIRDYNRTSGATIILTSHYMEDIKELCDRVIIINQGELMYDGNLNKLVQQHVTTKHLEIVFTKEISRQDLSKYGKIIDWQPPKCTISVPRKAVNATAAKLLQHFDIEDLNINEPKIESVIRNVFSKHD